MRIKTLELLKERGISEIQCAQTNYKAIKISSALQLYKLFAWTVILHWLRIVRLVLVTYWSWTWMSSYKTTHTIDLFSKYISSDWECRYSLPFQMWLPISSEVMIPVPKPEKKNGVSHLNDHNSFVITLMTFITRMIITYSWLSVLSRCSWGKAAWC